MIAGPVITENQLHAALLDQGFVKTEHHTETGTFWQNTKTKAHLLVPDKFDDGTIPDWMCDELVKIASELDPWAIQRAPPDYPQDH